MRARAVLRLILQGEKKCAQRLSAHNEHRHQIFRGECFYYVSKYARYLLASNLTFLYQFTEARLSMQTSARFRGRIKEIW